MSHTPTPALTLTELRAIDSIVAADRESIRAAARAVPSYQRLALVWLARELGLVEDQLSLEHITRPGTPRAHESARQLALTMRRKLEEALATSHALPQERALMAQQLAHLWQAFDQALGSR